MFASFTLGQIKGNNPIDYMFFGQIKCTHLYSHKKYLSRE